MRMAQNWAQTNANQCQMKHSSGNEAGENLYCGSAQLTNGRKPVENWYNEIKDYNWNRPGTGSGVTGSKDIPQLLLLCVRWHEYNLFLFSASWQKIKDILHKWCGKRAESWASDGQLEGTAGPISVATIRQPVILITIT